MQTEDMIAAIREGIGIAHLAGKHDTAKGLRDVADHLKGTAQTTEKTTWHYYVAYNFQGGVGNITISRTSPVRTADDVVGLAKFIAEENRFPSVGLVNWIELEG